jgi:hypothetical protein
VKRIILSLSAAIFLLSCLFHVEAGQFRSGVGFRAGAQHSSFTHFGSPVSRSSIVIINQHPVFFHQHRFIRSGNTFFFFPHHNFVGKTIIVSTPFFCFPDSSAFINEASFFEHLHRFHGIGFETIPSVIVRSGPQLFFFGW